MVVKKLSYMVLEQAERELWLPYKVSSEGKYGSLGIWQLEIVENALQNEVIWLTKYFIFLLKFYYNVKFHFLNIYIYIHFFFFYLRISVIEN